MPFCHLIRLAESAYDKAGTDEDSARPRPVRNANALISPNLSSLERRVEGIDARLERMDERFEHVAERFERIDECFDRMDQRFDALEGKLDRALDSRSAGRRSRKKP